MSGEALPALVVAIEIGEPELADRLAALLADVPGLRLAAPGEPSDATLVVPEDPPPGPDVGLSSRELDVLALIAEGASNKVIARRLAISVHTVKFHIASLLDKLDAQGARRRWRKEHASERLSSRSLPKRPRLLHARPGHRLPAGHPQRGTTSGCGQERAVSAPMPSGRGCDQLGEARGRCELARWRRRPQEP